MMLYLDSLFDKSQRCNSSCNFAFNPLKKAITRSLMLFIPLALSACGGSSPSPSPTPTPTPTPNQSPTVTTSNMMVEEGQTVTLTATATDSDGQITQFSWVQTAGDTLSILDADSNQATFIAPQNNGDQTFSFDITVTDDDGATATASLTITVQDVDTNGTVVSTNGGTVTSTDGKVTLEIPAGALTEEVAITVRPLPVDTVPAKHIHETLGIASLYQFSPEGLQFSVPVKVTLPYELESEQGVPPSWLFSGNGDGDDREYELLTNVTLDLEAGTISADMQHFSIGGILYLLTQYMNISITDTTEPDASDYLHGSDLFAATYSLNLGVGEVAVNAFETTLVELTSISVTMFEEIVETSYLANIEHSVAPPVSISTFTIDTSTNSDGLISGQCVAVNELGGMLMSAETRINHTIVEENSSPSAKLAALLGPNDSHTISIPGRVPVSCEERPKPAYPTDPVLTVFDGIMRLVEGFVVLDTLSLINNIAVSTICPQVLVVGDDGAALADPCNAEILKDYSEEEPLAGRDNFQTAVIAVPESDPQQAFFIQNNTMVSINPETNDPDPFVQLLDFSFSTPRSFIDITTNGNNPYAGVSYVDGTSYLGVHTYDQENNFFNSVRWILQDSVKSVVTSQSGEYALLINSTNQLVFYDLTTESPQRIGLFELGTDARRLRCDFVSGICAVSDFVGNTIQTFLWDGSSAPDKIVDTVTVADGPVEMAIQGNVLIVAGYRDNRLSVLQLNDAAEVTASEIFDLPQGCTGPGHTGFAEHGYLISCNTSNALLYLPKPEPEQ